MNVEAEFKKVFEYIKSNTKEENLKEFANYNPNNLADYHFSMGLWFRNNIIDNNNAISHFFRELNITNKDDISHLLILLFWYYTQ